MPLQVQIFTCQGGDHEFQDAACYSRRGDAVAIADGATVSVCQREWAEMLTRRFVEKPVDIEDERSRQQWWDESLADWKNVVTPRQEVWRERPAEYWMTSKLFQEAGGCATFLGLILHPRNGAFGYSMYAVGDCVGFWFQKEQFVKSEPAIESFDCTPTLLSTRRPFPRDGLNLFKGPILPGNLLVMVTDALAEYLTKHRPWEAEVDFWAGWRLKSNEEFASWANNLKRDDLMKPDDYTMALVRFD